MADNSVALIFVINGEDYPVEAKENAALMAAVEHALKTSGNQARPASEWELRDANGNLLDKNRSAKSYGLQNGAKLYLSLKVGAGG